MPPIHEYDSLLCSLYTGKYLHTEAAGSPRTHLPIHGTTRCRVPDRIFKGTITGTSNPI